MTKALCTWRTAAALAGVLAAGAAATATAAELPACRPLNLPIESLSAPPTAYREFCQRHPSDCDLGGPDTVVADGAVATLLERINREVNAQVRFEPDLERSGEEDRWDYPCAGKGDCEDIALEKRRRLVAAGLPRGAFTMAIAHHRASFFSHAVLLAQTARGTFVLNGLGDALLCWDRVPFNFETREHPDGRWSRYDQRGWYGPAASAAR